MNRCPSVGAAFEKQQQQQQQYQQRHGLLCAITYSDIKTRLLLAVARVLRHVGRALLHVGAESHVPHHLDGILENLSDRYFSR